uniref:Uncharacterized protein n=1 Tax=Anguilla anguilla TaxID=7936 RepID=A0A0E9PV84_ANGAN
MAAGISHFFFIRKIKIKTKTMSYPSS